jgi:hypothetical protein
MKETFVPEPVMRRTRPPSSPGRGNSLLPLQVRYYKRMRRGRTYPVQIRWKSAERGVAAKPVTLRLEVAGALVVPRELVLRPADPEDTATFFVTPLSKGNLPHHVIEVHSDNVKIYEMPLKAVVGTQRFTLFLLVMTFLVPWLLTNYCKNRKDVVQLIKTSLPDLTEFNETLPDWLKLKDWLDQGIEAVGTAYSELCGWCQLYPVATYAGLALFGLTLISAWWHKPKRRWRTGNPIPLPGL